jgi:PAS domain S-box-containing protein
LYTNAKREPKAFLSLHRGGNPRSLGSILAVFAFTLNLAALLIAGCLQVFFNIRVRNTALTSTQQLVATEAQRTVSGFIQEKISVLRSAIWITSPHALSPVNQESLLSGLLGHEPAIRSIVLLDVKDTVAALASRRSTTGVIEEDYLHWQEAGARIRADSDYLSPVYIDEASGEPLLLIALAVRDALGGYHGALLAEMNLKFMWDLVNGLKVGRTGYAYVVDRQGNLIAFGDAARVLARDNLKQLASVSAFMDTDASAGVPVHIRGYRGLKGEQVIGTFLPLGTPDWAVVVELPWAEAYSDTIRQIAVIVGLYLVMAALVSIVSVSMARRLSRPIERLMETASRIASGERGLQADVGGPREIAALSTAFNSMTSQLRDSLEELDRYFTSALDLLCISDTDGYFRRLNREWEATLGYPVKELEGRSLLDFVHPDDREQTLAELARLRDETEVLNFVNRYRHKDGSYRWIEWRSFPHGNLVYAVARDITKRKQDEEEIRGLNESLEGRVARRTAQLEAANNELETFAYSIAHDLRAPLRAINGYATIISNGYTDAFDEEGRRLMSIILKESLRMDQLIENLLTLSRVGRAALKPVKLDMAAMVRSAFDGLVEQKKRAQIDLRIGEIPAATGDPSFIRQVWINLLSNAVKFTANTPAAAISVEGAVRGNELQYSVRDNGVGFDMSYAEKLFGVFQRLHSPHEFEGNGIGLAIVRRIVALHGGRVWAEGEKGKGAAFSFSLPKGGSR